MPWLAPRARWLAVVIAVMAALLAFPWRAPAGPPSLVLHRWRADGCGVRDLEVQWPTQLTLKEPGCALTLRTQVALPQALRGVPLVLTVPGLWAPVHGSADGRALREPAEEGVLGYRVPPQHAFAVHASVERSLDLELVVTNTWVHAGWLRVPPRLAEAPRGDPAHRLVFLVNDLGPSLGFVTLLVLAVLYGGIFLRDRDRVAEGFFAAQMLAASFYPLFQWGALGALLGSLDLPVMAAGLCLAIASAVSFLRAHFGTRQGTWPFWVIALATAVLIFVTARRYDWVMIGASATVLSVGVGIAYIGITLVGKVRSGAPYARTFLLGWSIVGLSSGPDFLAWMGGPDLLLGARTGPLGLACFCIAQASAVSSAYASSLRRSQGLNDELRYQLGLLDERQREVEALNLELRRKLEERSESLDRAFLTLSRLGEQNVPLERGSLLDGRYVIDDVLGTGGMGTVYRATRREDGRAVAVKVLRETRNLEVMARFAREARLASRVRSSRVVDVLDVSVSADGLIYLVMELVEGTSLQRSRSRYGEVPWALHVLEQIAAGLAAIHGRGVVHRDLKPGNVLLGDEASGLPAVVKIADFGVSRFDRDAEGRASRPLTLPPPAASPPGSGAGTRSGASGPLRPEPSVDPSSGGGDTLNLGPDGSLGSPPVAMTRFGVVLGTPDYLAPEVADGSQRASAAADVYSFGVIAHELLCGAKPPRSSKPDGPRPFEDAGLSEPLATLLLSALASDPAARPPAQKLARALGDERATRLRALA